MYHLALPVAAGAMCRVLIRSNYGLQPIFNTEYVSHLSRFNRHEPTWIRINEPLAAYETTSQLEISCPTPERRLPEISAMTSL